MIINGSVRRPVHGRRPAPPCRRAPLLLRPHDRVSGVRGRVVPRSGWRAGGFSDALSCIRYLRCAAPIYLPCESAVPACHSVSQWGHTHAGTQASHSALPSMSVPPSKSPRRPSHAKGQNPSICSSHQLSGRALDSLHSGCLHQ